MSRLTSAAPAQDLRRLPAAGTARDQLATEGRDSLVLLLLSVLVTAGVAAAASALLSLVS